MTFVDRVDRLIGEEMVKGGVKRPDALARVARAAGLMPGTVANYLRGRLKSAERAERALKTYLADHIARGIADLENELAVLRASGLDAGDIDVVAAEAALENARVCIGRAKR